MYPKKALAGGVGVFSAALLSSVLLAPAAGATEARSNAVDSAFAISASGLLRIDATPAVDDSNGFAEEAVPELTLPALADLKLLTARAGAEQARASIADLRVGLGLGKPALTASAVEANCAHGKPSSSLADARVGDLPLDVQAPPNTAVKVPGLLSVTLNKQVTRRDGSVTVTAVSINVDNLQRVDLASATCLPGSGPTTEPDQPEPTQPEATPVGEAPRPTPVKAHLDVTG